MAAGYSAVGMADPWNIVQRRYLHRVDTSMTTDDKNLQPDWFGPTRYSYIDKQNEAPQSGGTEAPTDRATAPQESESDTETAGASPTNAEGPEHLCPPITPGLAFGSDGVLRNAGAAPTPICMHGNLRRSCVICDLERENAELQRQLSAMQLAGKISYDTHQKELTILRAELQAATLAANDERTNNTMTLPEVIADLRQQLAIEANLRSSLNYANDALREQLAKARRKALEGAADAAGKKKEVVLLDADEDKQFWLGYGQGRADAEIEIRALQAQGKEGE